jgi:hypothetical protein
MRPYAIALVVGSMAILACTGGGSGSSLDLDAGGGVSSTSSGGGASSTSSSGGASSTSSSGGTDAAPDAPTSCVTQSTQIAIIQTASGQCSYKFSGSYDPNKINLVLTPGWGTVCFAGSSSNCGTGSSADGWWFSAPGEISVCDATCARFEKQTIAGKFTVEQGCPTQACMH